MNVHVFKKERNYSFIDVRPGDWVVIKPNLVKQSKETDPNEWESVITSPMLIREVLEDVCVKLKGEGRITICDAPQTDSSFREIAKLLDLDTFILNSSQKYRIQIELVDLRDEEWTAEEGIIVRREKLKGDPNGKIAINLGKFSLFYKHKGEGKYYGADYDSQIVNRHHHGETQEYLICGTPTRCDVFINMPKMKTHKKTGVTLSLKNLVGINADKNWLPHHTEGSPDDGGDQFPVLGFLQKLENVSVHFARKLALRIPVLGPMVAKKMRAAGTKVFGETQKVIRSGNWYGNNTTWRMSLDLNRCLLYGNMDGSLRMDQPKRYYTVVDGLIGMEGEGPMQGFPIHSNVVIGGIDPVAVDIVAARYMGFDYRKIPILRESLKLVDLPITKIKNPSELQIVSDVPELNVPFSEYEKMEHMKFEPHFGWKGHIEYGG